MRQKWFAAVGLLVASSTLVACGDDVVPSGDAAPTGGVRVTAATAAESSGRLDVVVERLGDPFGALRVTYATADGTSRAGFDFEAVTGELLWLDGDASPRTVGILVVDDLLVEGDETLMFDVADAAGAPLASEPLTIGDDDRLGLMIGATDDRIISFDATAPDTSTSSAPIVGLATGERPVGIAIRPADGKLYAVTTKAAVYVIDPITGAAVRRASLPIAIDAALGYGVAFDPVRDRLRIVSARDSLRVDVDTGTSVSEPVLGMLAGAAYANAAASACRTTLFALDRTANQLVAIRDTPGSALATPVGPLGQVVGAAPLAIQTDAAGVDSAFAALGTTLFRVDLQSGAATPIGALAEPLRGLAIPPIAVAAQPPGELLAVTDDQRVVSFERATPDRACTSAAISGLAPGDAIAAIDTHPVTGALEALSTGGRLYTLDPATGAATGAVQLDRTLDGTAFEIDFDPTGDLRVLSDTGQNVRVTDRATGATVLDPPFAGAVRGLAYTDAFAGAAATSLFFVDREGDRLRQSFPGSLLDFPKFDVDITDVEGFDIDGRDGTAFAAVVVGGATQLRTIDLSRGTISSPLGTFSHHLRGLAQRTPVTTVFALSGTKLVRVPLENPAGAAPIGEIGGLAAGDELVGIDVDPLSGTLFGVGRRARAYELDPATARVTRTIALAPAVQLAGARFDLAFDRASAQRLRVVSDLGESLAIDVRTGAVSSVAAPAFVDIVTAIAYDGPTLYGLDFGRNVLATLDTATGAVTTIAPTFAPLNGALDIAAHTAIAADGSRIYEVDLATGEATTTGFVNLVTTNSQGQTIAPEIKGIAIASTVSPLPADATVFVVDDHGELYRFTRNAPSAAVPVGSIGAAGALGMDIQPSTGDLWVLAPSTVATGAGVLLRVNPATASVQDVRFLDLRPSGIDTEANRVDVDFDPAQPDVLRIVGAGRDGRTVSSALDIATKKILADPAPAFPAVQAVGLAFDRFGSPFVIDAATEVLLHGGFRFAPLGLAIEGDAALALAGRDALALAMFRLRGETASRLYRIDLRTGQPTELGTIGGGPVRGLAIGLAARPR